MNELQFECVQSKEMKRVINPNTIEAERELIKRTKLVENERKKRNYYWTDYVVSCVQCSYVHENGRGAKKKKLN